MSISVNKVVKVTITSSPTFPARKGFGLLNIVGVSNKLPTGDRIRFYSDMDGVAADFASTDEEYIAANKFFAQRPRATELAISRRFNTATPAELLASFNYEKDLADWNAITNGMLRITVDGTQRTTAAMNFSTDANFNAVASRIQAALIAAGATGASVVFTGSRFIIRSGTTGVTSTLSYATAPGSGTDVGPLLGADAAGLGKITNGAAVETIADSLTNINNLNGSWYGVTLTAEATEQNIKDAAEWTEARVKLFGYTTSASNVLDGGTTADIASYFKSVLYDRTVGQYDNDDPYAIVSFFARAFTVNFNGENTTITMKFKQEPGITPVEITESQRLVLVSKNINYYTYFGDSAMLAEGVMASGRFFDEVHGIDWLQNAIETNVFGTLFTSPTKIPQTDKGVARLVQSAEKACGEAVRNGLLAPGYWNGSDLGEVKNGDFLPKGYYLYAQPVRDQNQSDREARKAPPIQGLLKGAGAIHFADVSLTFER